MKTRHTLPFLLFLAAIAATPAPAAVGDWGQGVRAKARLVAAGIGADGRLQAGVEIVVPAGSETYWRTPGDAGVAPGLDFTGSKNVGAVAVRFPVPTRLDDGFSVTNVYYDRVVFLLDAPVGDPKQPVDLHLALSLGVCDQVCVPDAVAASVHVPADRSDPDAAKLLAAVAPSVPGPAEPGTFAIEKVERTGGKESKPEFRITGVIPDAAKADIFAEGPEGWFATTPAYQGAEGGSAVYSLVFSRLGSPVPVAGARLRFTIRAAGRAIEQAVTLP
jgi:DsbC/DsbD-like thiol-disulfide interchange protein